MLQTFGRSNLKRNGVGFSDGTVLSMASQYTIMRTVVRFLEEEICGEGTGGKSTLRF